LCLLLFMPLFFSSLIAQEGGDAGLYLRQAEALEEARLFPEAIHFYQEAIRILEEQIPAPREQIIDNYLAVARSYRRYGELDSAFFYLEKARLLGEQYLPPDAPVLSDVYNALGIYYYYQGKCKQANAFYERALAKRLAHYGRWNGRVADSYNNLAICYDMMGRHEEAIAHYEKALEIRLRLYDECSPPVAECYMNIGVGYHYLLDFDQALAYYDKALEIWEETLPPDHPDFALIFNNMGVCYQNKGDYRRAQEILERNLQYTIEVHGAGHFEVANAYNNLGLNFYEQGDFAKALVYFEKALAIRLQHFKPDHHLIASLYNNIGNCHRRRKDFVKAFFYCSRGLEIRLKAFGPYHREVADSYNDLGLYYEAIGDYAQALVQYRQALEIDRQLDDEPSVFVADSYLRMGRCFFQEGDLDQARAYYEKALQFKQKALGSLHPEVAEVLTELGRCYPDHPERGLVYVDRAMKALRLDRAGRVNQMQVTAPLQALRTLNVEGELHLALYRQSGAEPWLQEAHSTFQMARRVIERTRRGYQEPGSKQLLLDQFFQIFEHSIEVAQALYERHGDRQYLEEALVIAENSKNVLLNEAVQKAHANEFAGIPQVLVQRENDLLLDINYYEAQTLLETQKGEKGDAKLLDFFREKLFQRKSAYYSLLDTLAVRYPDYYELRYGKPDFSLVRLQARLATGNETLVEYFAGDRLLFLFVVNPDTIALFARPGGDSLHALIRDLRQQIFTFDPLAGDLVEARQAFVRTALPLYQNLIAPFAPLIRSEGLIIVPDGLLGHLPFECLLTRQPGPGGSWKDLPYLIHQYRVSYQYTASLLITGRPESELPAKARVLALAPAFDATTGLKPLHYNQEEVRAIHKQIPGRYLLGSEATEAAFRQWAGEYRVVHLATHAQANDTIGAQSYLAFSAPPDTSQGAFLFLRDLYNLRLDADMVVLSACETGMGEWQRGEGIVSLGRGFLYAGARSIVTTLWSVDDRPSAWIMGRFYRELKEGYPKDEALRRAKLEYLQANSALRAHPLFWAAYIPLGDMQAVAFQEKPGYWVVRAAAALAVLILGISVFKWFRKPW
jgi:CHAT domain-containing protein/tetratricopeptide (TPR) repeat protein